MDSDRVYYFTDASIIKHRHTFGGVKAMFSQNDDIYILGNTCYRTYDTNDIHVLECMAILAALNDIWANRYLKAFIVTDSNTCYDNIKKLAFAANKLAPYPKFFINKNRKPGERIAMLIDELYRNWPYQIDLQWDCVKSHVNSNVQWEKMKKYNPDCTFKDAMNFNRGNMIVDDLVSSFAYSVGVFEYLPVVSVKNILNRNWTELEVYHQSFLPQALNQVKY